MNDVTKTKHTLKFDFQQPDGTVTRSPTKDTIALAIGEQKGEHVVPVTMVTKGQFEATGLLFVAAWHGLKQSLNDASTSKGAGASIEDRIELLQARLETLMDGEWLSERESAGPRISDIAVALGQLKGYADAKHRAESIKALGKMAKEAGKELPAGLETLTDATEFAVASIAAYRAIVGEEAGKTYLANLRKAPQVAAIVTELEAKRKLERASKLKSDATAFTSAF